MGRDRPLGKRVRQPIGRHRVAEWLAMGLSFLLLAACAPGLSGADGPESGVDTAPVVLPECAPLRMELQASWEGADLPAAGSDGSVWPGAAIADFTGDGLPDVVYAVVLGTVLIRNEGGGNWTPELLLADGEPVLSVRSATAADFDDDGDVDLFLGGELPAPSQFLTNHGDGSFSATPLTGLDHRVWSAALGEFSGSGRLDLFVATYDADLSLEAIMAGSRGSGQALLVQDGTGAWSEQVGALPAFTDDAMSLQGAPLDADGDGILDVYLVNDFGPYAVPNQLLHNDGTGHFAAVENSGADISIYAMGAGVGDLNGDGHPDLFVSDVGPPHYLVNDGAGGFADATQAADATIPATPTNLTSWGVSINDMDRDGWDDVLVAYGGLGSSVDVTQLENADPAWEDELLQYSVLLRNLEGTAFARDDAAFTDLARARGLAVGDLDLDGRADLITWGKHYLHLFVGTGGCDPGVSVVLDGPPGNPHGIGAKVEATVNGRLITRWLLPSTTAGQSALEVLLGTHGLPAEDLTVTWPDGTRQEVGSVEAGARITVAATP